MKVFRKRFGLNPPVWETSKWDEMSWDEKMAIWHRHRKISTVLTFIYLVCFVGSLLWVVNNSADAKVVGAFNVIMLVCLFIARFLMD